ncbi:isoprenoid biosynthesis glyoxalase ElbB [Chlorobium phaeovibrioides]|uniref:Isoprenoid biosynthesis glyoxalase ElbB n=1 Tax=Chlorobium phaeovibrioides TaxID=1094 RepID=A0A5M8IFK3_CHLPH|nr:isoprenoid biosynthesis glyoxalase ElbB [Chlorobium phaeovibrioides]KAA6233069.1 isoprenoid biosynthesis glyoxalase ElbB [Chlorobium phaeovibrioides]MWV53650.1 isoprenoid biosynthesis glyoxalase ElbB [Chlorobium phaeovibrioides]
MKKTGVILSGCGFLDGSEIHEAVLTLLALDRAGIEAVMLAPDIPQTHTVNHRTGEVEEGQMRNVLDESARIARGAVTDLALIDTLELDALILPGGYGAAKNLSDYAFKGAECSLNPDVAHAIRSFHTAGKPIGFICIAPALAAQVLGAEHPPLTIGNDPSTAEDLEKMGARHVDCPVWNAIVWNEGKVVSTPAYMLGPSIAEVAKGIDRLVEELARLL